MKKKTALVFASVIIVSIAGIIAFNSSTTPSKNKEGIVELTGPSDVDSNVTKGQHTVTTMGFRLPGSNQNSEK